MAVKSGARWLLGFLRAALVGGRRRGGARYDRVVDAVNRLPRPLMALGCLGFFAYAALRPEGFRGWMGALQTVPEPMWWLVTGILGLHFGARETFYLRGRGEARPDPPRDEAA